MQLLCIATNTQDDLDHKEGCQNIINGTIEYNSTVNLALLHFYEAASERLYSSRLLCYVFDNVIHFCHGIMLTTNYDLNIIWMNQRFVTKFQHQKVNVY